MRLGVVNVFEARHVEVHRHIGDDGFPCAVVFSPIAVETDDGREFFLPQGEAAIDEDGIRPGSAMLTATSRVSCERFASTASTRIIGLRSNRMMRKRNTKRLGIRSTLLTVCVREDWSWIMPSKLPPGSAFYF